MRLFAKRSILVSTAIIMAIALSACGGSNSATNSPAKPAESSAQPAESNNSGSASFPDKEITIVVTNKAGGSNDLVVRSIQPFLQKALGVPVVLKNVDGAGGNVARAQIFKEKPDGYTLMETPMPSMGIGEIVEDGEFKTTEFVTVFNLYGKESMVVIVPNESPIKTVDDLIKLSKEKDLNASGSGTATNSVLGSIFLKEKVGVKHQYVPFKGGTEAATQVAGGHVDFGIASDIAAASLVQEGKVRAIAYLGNERSNKLPDVPTLVEAGFKDAKFEIIYGFYAPPGTPKEIVTKLENAFETATKDPEFKDAANKSGFTLQVMKSEEFKKSVETIYQDLVNNKDSFNLEK